MRINLCLCIGAFLVLVPPLFPFYQPKPLATIEVNSSGSINRALVLGAARLQVGDETGTDGIEAAVARVNRLPFVLDVSYDLSYDDEGKGHLVLHVTEKRPYEIDFSTDLFRSSEFSGSEQRDTAGLIGRYYLGPGQMLRMAVEPDWSWGGSTFTNGSVRLRYEHFNLFKRGFYLRAEVEQQDDSRMGSSSFFSSETDYEPTYQLEVAVPLAGDHRLHLNWSRTGSDRTSESGPYIYDEETIGPVTNEGRHRADEWNLSWRHNRLDSDFAPREGSLFAATIRRYNGESRYVDRDFGNDRVYTYQGENESDSFEVAYRRHRPLRPRHSWFYGGSAVFSRAENQWPQGNIVADTDAFRVAVNEFETDSYRVFSGYSWDLFDGGRMSRFGGLRLDLLGGVNYRDYESMVDQPNPFNSNRTGSQTVYEMKANLSYRQAWGTFGLGLAYDYEP